MYTPEQMEEFLTALGFNVSLDGMNFIASLNTRRPNVMHLMQEINIVTDGWRLRPYGDKGVKVFNG